MCITFTFYTITDTKQILSTSRKRPREMGYFRRTDWEGSLDFTSIIVFIVSSEVVYHSISCIPNFNIVMESTESQDYFAEKMSLISALRRVFRRYVVSFG